MTRALRYLKSANLGSLAANLRGSFRYLSEERQFPRAGGYDLGFERGRRSPKMADRTEASGVASGHYFLQDLYVARRIFERAPRRHIDVGSRIDGFVAHVASFRSIEVVDIRPQSATVENITFIAADLTNGSAELGVSDSVSCLHALEHFGLGRYGDRIDPRGHERGLGHLASLLARDGVLYLALPVAAVARIEFNSQRVFTLTQIWSLLQTTGLTVLELALIDDGGKLHTVKPSEMDCPEFSNLRNSCAILTCRLA